MTCECSDVWMQQAGKSDEECQRDYIMIVATCDSQFDIVVKGVIEGTVKQIGP